MVSDSSAALPVVRRRSREAGTGRGLWLLDHYSLRHGVALTRNGKQVWCELRPESSADGEGDDAALARWLDQADIL